MNFNVFELQPHQWLSYQVPCQALESAIEYPLAEDRFILDHGSDYFAFFKRLGTLRFFVAEAPTGELAGVIAAVKRPEVHATLANAWYIADLKVAVPYRHQQVPALLFQYLTEMLPKENLKFYGICMNEAEGHNKVIPMLQKTSGFPLSLGEKLLMYDLNADEMWVFQQQLEAERQEVSFLSLAGKKDLILQSNGQPMPLLHVQFGPFAEKDLTTPKQGYSHLFSLPESDPLNARLKEMGIGLFASASTVYYGLDNIDWAEVLTSDI